MPGSELLLRPRRTTPRRRLAASSPCSLSLSQEAKRALPSALQLQAVLLHTALQGGQGCLVPTAGHCVQSGPPPPGCHISHPSAAVEGVPLQPASSAVACMPTSSACISFECHVLQPASDAAPTTRPATVAEEGNHLAASRQCTEKAFPCRQRCACLSGPVDDRPASM